MAQWGVSTTTIHDSMLLSTNWDNLETELAETLQSFTGVGPSSPWSSSHIPLDSVPSLTSFPSTDPSIPIFAIAEDDQSVSNASQSIDTVEVIDSHLEAPLGSISNGPSSDMLSNVSWQSSIDVESPKNGTTLDSIANRSAPQTPSKS
jgi:hypothetical protein